MPVGRIRHDQDVDADPPPQPDHGGKGKEREQPQRAGEPELAGGERKDGKDRRHRISRSARPHPGVKKAHKRLEPVFLGRHDQPAQRIGEERTPGRLALRPPGGLGGAFGRIAFERDEASGRRVVGGKQLSFRQGALPGILDPEADRLVAPLEDRPALRRGPGREVAEPDEHAVLGGGAGEESPGNAGLGAGRIEGRRRPAEQGRRGMQDGPAAPDRLADEIALGARHG